MSLTGAGQGQWEVVGELFAALASPLRVGIIALLCERPRSVAEIVDELAVPQPLVSHHLRVLRERCLVIGEPAGRRTMYRLMDDHVGHIVSDALLHAGEHEHSATVHESEEPS